MKIGEQLREHRDKAMLTQDELGKRAGLSGYTISRIESDQVEPRVSTMRKIASALGIKPEELTARPKVAASLSPREASTARPEFSELPGLMAARKSRGYSRNELAARSGVASSDIAALEEGTREADSDILDRLTGALDATSGELGFPPEQYASFLEADERDNERIRRELAELSHSEMRTLIMRALLESRGARKVRDAIEESPEHRSSKRPEAG